jgi:putative membrane protein
MKTLRNIFGMAVMIALLTTACSKKAETDSKEIAEDQNEEKFDTTKLEDDTEFAVAAADGGMLEVQLGEVALKNASSPEVKKFAQQMIDDHGKAGTELKELASSKNISLPGMLSEKNQKKIDDLSKKTGKEFDEDYVDFMVKDHKDDIDAFEKEAEKGNDADLKAWASGKLPTLKHHLHMAEQADSILSKRK